MQIKTTMRYHCTPVRMTVSKDPRRVLVRDVEKRNIRGLLGTPTGAATIENSMKVPQKIKNNYHMTQQSHF